MPLLDDLNERYFGGRLSPAVRTLMAPLNDEREEVLSFVERMCRNMRRQRIGAEDFNETLAWSLGYFLPKLLPGAWGGSVPPITSEGRHGAIDAYMECNPWRVPGPGDRLLDVGCGFPPFTTMESARRFPDVQVTGAGPSFAPYLVSHENGDYACFDSEAELLYFQPATHDVERWEGLYRDPKATRARFREPLLAALDRFPAGGADVASSEEGDYTVLEDPVGRFSADNVSFAREAIGSDALGHHDVVRCMNVLLYFDGTFRDRTLQWTADVLTEGGLLVAGVNWTGSRHSRLTAFRREGGSIVPKEFAFSVENVRPMEMVAWFVLHDDDDEMKALTELVGVIRSNDGFRRAFDGRMDEMLLPTGFTSRRDNGYLGFLDETVEADPLGAADAVGRKLEGEGFAEEAAGLLRAAGYDAWVNCIGHIAVDPEGLGRR